MLTLNPTYESCSPVMPNTPQPHEGAAMSHLAFGATLGLAAASLAGPAEADAVSASPSIRDIRMVIHEGRIQGIPAPLVLKVGVPVRLSLVSVSQQPGVVSAPELFERSSAQDLNGRPAPSRVHLMTLDTATFLLTPQEPGRFGIAMSGFRWFRQASLDSFVVEVTE